MPRIKAISLDFYNTIVRFEPMREHIQATACLEFGIPIDADAIRRAYPTADHFLSQENGNLPLGRRSPQQVREFWVRYEMLLLDEAGVTVDLETANRIVERVLGMRQEFVLFPDVVPMLKAVCQEGYFVGVVTNFEGGLAQVLLDLDIAEYLSFAVTSEEVGVAKPNARIFAEALDRAGVRADEAIHIGDQPYADVQGAADAGIMPVLLDRDNVFEGFGQTHVIRSLAELPNLLRARVGGDASS